MTPSTEKSNAYFRFFFPDARVLSAEEVNALPEQKKEAAKASGKDGLWLEVYCPDASCITEDGRITLSSPDAVARGEKGFLLNLFCPEDSCELNQSTDLP